MLESSIRTTPSAPTDRCGVQMRRVSSVALPIRPLRLSMTTKSLPPPAILENDSASCFTACTCPEVIGIFAAAGGLNRRCRIVARKLCARNGNGPTAVIITEETRLKRIVRSVAVVFVTTEPGKPLPTPVVQQAKEEIPDTLRRRIIFFIDNLSLMPFNRNRVFKEMKEFAKNVMRPGDEAMVATYNRSMKVRVSFTRDPILIAQTLDIIAGESALGVSNKSESRDVQKRIEDAQTYDEALATARSYSQSVEHDLRQTVSSLD